jgi:hypothetical protein
MEFQGPVVNLKRLETFLDSSSHIYFLKILDPCNIFGINSGAVILGQIMFSMFNMFYLNVPARTPFEAIAS